LHGEWNELSTRERSITFSESAPAPDHAGVQTMRHRNLRNRNAGLCTLRDDLCLEGFAVTSTFVVPISGHDAHLSE